MNRRDMTNNETVRKWYTPDSYPDVDPKIFDKLYEINWEIEPEDVECLLYNDSFKDFDFDHIVDVDYVDDDTFDKLSDRYEGAYLFTYDNGETRIYAWRPYPHNLDALKLIKKPTNNKKYKSRNMKEKLTVNTKAHLEEAFNQLNNMNKPVRRLVENTNSDKAICTRKIAEYVGKIFSQMGNDSVNIDVDESTGTIHLEKDGVTSDYQISVNQVYVYTLSETLAGPVYRNGRAGNRQDFISDAAYDIIVNHNK